MANGKWQMANGKWQMANGKWQMANGKWQLRLYPDTVNNYIKTELCSAELVSHEFFVDCFKFRSCFVFSTLDR